MFCDEWALLLFRTYGCLYFSSTMNIGICWCYESYACLCHNVTRVVTWQVTSYGGAGDKSPAPRASINRFGKKNSFHFNIEIEKPIQWFNFWTRVILFVWPSDDNHDTFSIFTYFSSENIRSGCYSTEKIFATEIHFFLSRYQSFVFHGKPNSRPMNEMKNIKRSARAGQGICPRLLHSW